MSDLELNGDRSAGKSGFRLIGERRRSGFFELSLGMKHYLLNTRTRIGSPMLGQFSGKEKNEKKRKAATDHDWTARLSSNISKGVIT